MRYLFFVLSFCATNLFAQNSIQGEMTYLVSMDKNDFKKVENQDPNVSKRVNDLIKNSHDVYFILSFNKNESLYKKSEVLKNDAQGSLNLTEIMAGNNNTYYHNSQDNSNVMVMNVGGKDYIVSKPKVEWKLLKESKMIGEFLCYKAIVMNNTNDIVAWYAPSIAVNHGPNSFNGLPGLILELKNNKLSYLAENINLKPKKVEDISRPINGEKLTYEEFKKKFGDVFKE
jgi:GLPGLI family protein